MFTELLDLKVYMYCAYDVRKNEKAWDPFLQAFPKMK